MRTLYFIILISLLSGNEALDNKMSASNQKNKLIFIYNASNDYLSVAFDFTHKIISPKTYQCSLCQVTYGAFTMHNEWKEYLDSMNFEIIFLKLYFGVAYFIPDNAPPGVCGDSRVADIEVIPIGLRVSDEPHGVPGGKHPTGGDHLRPVFGVAEHDVALHMVNE